MLFDQAGAHAFFQTGGDFFLGHSAVGCVIYTQKFQHNMGAE